MFFVGDPLLPLFRCTGDTRYLCIPRVFDGWVIFSSFFTLLRRTRGEGGGQPVLGGLGVDAEIRGLGGTGVDCA